MDYRAIYLSLIAPAFTDSFRKFLSLDWWSRLWIYQEATLNPSLKLCCVSSQVEFDVLYRSGNVLLWAAQNGIFDASHIGHDAKVSFQLHAIGTGGRQHHDQNRTAPLSERLPNDFLYYLSHLGHRGVSDSRDVVYAAMGLDETYPKKIVPDYSQRIEDVWTSASRELIKRDQDLVSLSFCAGVLTVASEWADYRMANDNESTQNPIPTSVSIWGKHRQGMGAKNLSFKATYFPEFQACDKFSTAHAKFSKDGRILFAKGIVVDVVKEVVPGYERPARYDAPNRTDNREHSESSSLDCIRWHETFKSWEQAATRAAPVSPKYVLEGTKAEALIYSLHAPFMREYSDAGQNFDKNEEYLVELHGPQLMTVLANAGSGDSTPAEPSGLATRMWEREQDQRKSSRLTLTFGSELIVTERGYIGVGLPKHTEFGGILAGDLLVVLCGAVAPFFLRQVGSRDRYLLAGDAYIHGLMYGAAMEGMKFEDMKKFSII